MSINDQVETVANLQVGPTDQGMVRIYINGEGVSLPLDFEPDEALDIAEELQAAAEAARSMASSNENLGKKPRR